MPCHSLNFFVSFSLLFLFHPSALSWSEHQRCSVQNMLKIFRCSLVACDYEGHTEETVTVGTDVAVSVVARALTPSRLARSGSDARNGGLPMSLR